MVIKLLKKESGLTYTETIIYVGIVAIVVVTIVSILVQLVNMKTRADTFSAISSETTNFFEKIITDVRNSDSFTVENSTTLTLTKEATTYQYFLQDNQIYFNDGIDSYALTSTLINVDNLTFSDWTSPNSANLLHVQLELERGGINEEFQTSIHKR